MFFRNCTFNNGCPHVPGAKFEGCTFNITDPEDTNQLPAAWQCVDCMVVCNGETYTFGRSSN